MVHSPKLGDVEGGALLQNGGRKIDNRRKAQTKGGDIIKITKDEKIISALISNPTIRAASEACGVSETQIYARLRNPEFKARYDEARRDLLARATAALQSRLTGAVEVMGEICGDTETAPQTRLNAADAIIRNTLKMTEQADILARLDELEAAMGGEHE